MTKSELFRMYNKARSAARQGKLDESRVNSALSVLQSKNQPEYFTTITSCTCPDRKFHPRQACKHMIAEMIRVRVNQTSPEYAKVQAELATPFVNGSDGTVYTAEQGCGSYVLHTFSNIEDAQLWATMHQAVRPSQARGRRIRPDFDHR